MLKKDKKNNVEKIQDKTTILYKDIMEFLGKLKKTDKIEVFDLSIKINYTGYVRPYVCEGKIINSLFFLVTKAGPIIFCVNDLLLNCVYFDKLNNRICLMVEKCRGQMLTAAKEKER